MKKICDNCFYYKRNSKYREVGICNYFSSPASIIINHYDYDRILKCNILYKEYKVKTVYVRSDYVCRFFSNITNNKLNK